MLCYVILYHYTAKLYRWICEDPLKRWLMKSSTIRHTITCPRLLALGGSTTNITIIITIIIIIIINIFSSIN